MAAAPNRLASEHRKHCSSHGDNSQSCVAAGSLSLGLSPDSTWFCPYITCLLLSSWSRQSVHLLGMHKKSSLKVPRGFELRSLDSESRVLTVTPRDQVSAYTRVGICACRGVQLPDACAVRILDTCFLDYEGDALVMLRVPRSLESARGEACGLKSSLGGTSS